MKNKKLILSVIIFSTLLTTFSLYFFQIFFSPNFLINSDEKKIYIQESTSFKNLQDTLDQKGYIEDRRPNANMDPYVVARLITNTCCSALA